MIDAATSKRNSVIFQQILGDPVMMKAINKFGGEIIDRSSIVDGLIRALAEVPCLDPEKPLDSILEIGCFNGLTSLLLARYARRVYTIDIWSRKEFFHVIDECYDPATMGKIDRIIISTESEKAREIAKLKFDFAYLDGNHSRDTASDFAATKRCGKILFHEYWPDQQPVWNLVNSFPAGEVKQIEPNFAYWERLT